MRWRRRLLRRQRKNGNSPKQTAGKKMSRGALAMEIGQLHRGFAAQVTRTMNQARTRAGLTHYAGSPIR